jgi:hypothetical protein
MKFIHLVRDPRRVLASLKHVRPIDGDRRQYHPLVYARYWQMASALVTQAAGRYPGRILCVRFEDFLATPQQIAETMAEFLGTRIDALRLSGTNSSFSGEQSRCGILPSEEWICERIAGPAMADHGYAADRGSLRVRDLPDLARSTLRFAAYQGIRVARNPSARQSIRWFLQRL